MPSFGRPREPQVNAIVGAARRIHINRADEIERMRIKNTQEWQRIAWAHYDGIGEIKYAFNYFSAIASRVRLYVGYQEDESEEPTPIGNAADVSRSLAAAARYELRKLSSGRGGQPNLIRALTLNLLVTGEVYLVGHGDTWAARSTSELRFESDDRIRLITSRNAGRDINTYLPPDAFVARIWRTHPEYSDDSDSSLKGVETECSELILLSRIIRASSQSRLNAGILYVADELRFEKSSDLTGSTPDPDSDPFEEELTTALTEPIGITDSPSEIVPMIVRGPADYIDKGIKHIDLSRSFDDVLVKRHDQTLGRVLNGLDLPKDLVTGVAHVRYANSVTIAEDMLKAHVEPAMLIVVEALTTVYLKPQLIARGYDPMLVNRICVWYDPSEVVTRADRSADADTGYERMLVSGSAWRRAHGFSDRDAPTSEELIQRIALTGVVPPEATVAMLRALAPELITQAEKLADADSSKAMLPAADLLAQAPAALPQAPGPKPPPAGNQLPGPSTAGRPTAPIRSKEPAPGGILPPRDNQQQAAQVIEILRSITAGGTHQTVEVQDRTRRVERALDVERRLRESVSTYLNGIVHRALERAGARTVSKIRNDATLKSLVADVPIEEAFSRVPLRQRVPLGLIEEQLVADTIEKGRDGYFSMIREAQSQGWYALDPAVYTELAPSQDGHISNSWQWLTSRLVELAIDHLRDPRKTGAYVDIGTVRAATGLAGGAENLSNADPTIVVDASDSGRAILSAVALKATKWSFSNRRRWVYGVGDQTSDPHLALDGQVFTDWECEELRNFSSHSSSYHFFPGDHDTCRCDWLPEITNPYVVNGQQWKAMENAVTAATNGHGEVNGHAS